MLATNQEEGPHLTVLPPWLSLLASRAMRINLWCFVYKPASPHLWYFVIAAKWTEAHASNLTSMPTGGLVAQAESQGQAVKGQRGALQPSAFCFGRFLQIRYRGRQDSKLLSSGFRKVYKGLLFSCLLGHNKNVIMVQQANLSGSEPEN